MNYKYSLLKGSKHLRCPQCGQKTLKPYVDNANGEIVGEKYGRCERINNCNYNNYPKATKSDKYEYVPKEVVVVPTDYIDKKLVQETFTAFNQNPFFMYILRKFGKEKAFEVQEKYNIGTARNGGTIFWQEDQQGRFRTAKVMYYQPNGKRDKQRKSWFVHKQIKPDFNFRQCFFGLHLTTPDNPIALCESEKTAILMSIVRPEFTWVASGGSEMLNLQRLTELPRLDYVFADNKQTQKWAERTGKIFPDRVVDMSVDMAIGFGGLEEGSDIWDLWELEINNLLIKKK